jgi:hypothetical protein
MGVESPFYCPCAHTFARALAYKYMIPVCVQSWLKFSALTDGSLQDVHYQQSLAQFAATGGATGPLATCVARSPSTLPFSHLAPRCHRVCHWISTWNSHFCLYKAVATHFGSSTCQTEGKGVRTVTMQYRPSWRAEDQEAGHVGAPGAWPVWPAANTAPGKHTQYHMLHCSVLAYVFIDIGVQDCIMVTLHTIWPYNIV